MVIVSYTVVAQVHIIDNDGVPFTKRISEVFTGTRSECIDYLKMQHIDASIKMIDAVDEGFKIDQKLDDDSFVLSMVHRNSKITDLYHMTIYTIRENRIY